MLINKKIIFIFIFLLILNFFLIKKIFATGSYITGCLKTVNTYKPSCVEGEYPCLDLPNDMINIFGGKEDHILKIEGDGFPTNKNIYIVSCISTNEDAKCTTGEDERLREELKKEGIDFTLNKFDQHEFKAQKNPVRTDNGKVSLIVRSYTPSTENHLFLGVVALTEDKGYGYGGESQTIQYGTFGFSYNYDRKKCISIRWDPKGRIFDSVSLEPLPETNVSLLNNDKKLVNLIGLKNPISTKIDGFFNFFVPNGTYYLNVQKANYQWPLEMSDVNSKYKDIYYCDDKLGYPLYYDQEIPIIEENQLIHCDVPLKPLAEPYRGEVVAMEYGQIALGNTFKYFGRFSHPFTIVKLKQAGKTIETVTADKFGNWDVSIDIEKISSKEGEVIADGVKNTTYFSSMINQPFSSLNSISIFFKKILGKIFKEVRSQTMSNKIIFHPILRHVEGYAYDSKGEIISEATINIITKMDGKVYTQTKADKSGFFRIYSNQLPIFSYYLEIIDPKKPKTKNTITTSQFLRLNENYLTENNINLINATKNNQLIATATPLLKKPLTVSPKDTGGFIMPTKTSALETKTQTSQNKNLLLIVAIVLFLMILLVGGLIFFYLKKKETSSSY